MVITLIGYRGCGKTSVARLLAERLGWDWIDADVVIEQNAGQSIKEIFDTEGEPGFRQRERETIHQLLQQDQLILASGGGAILNEQTRTDMQASGPVVWLNAPAETLAERIEADALSQSQRPSLTGKSISAEVAEVLEQREPLYRETATVIIDAAASSPEQIARKIEQVITEQQQHKHSEQDKGNLS
ncbi:Shikimate kinase 2 [Polystyrenella longa]|uniref:Shikimate kinase n=1 Tax=Polystyrenella longa TaxID=2528007 RepID=A0A518CK33_9PLAN|nr:shikimate kinase AroL [Polystyrenella longa]QDU79581.1 Shikimate kinase 2 [Polystyrenella longa]